MIIQIANLVSGFVLSGSLLGEIKGLRETVVRAERMLSPYKRLLGVVEFTLGVLQLLDRADVIFVSFLTGGFPQALLAVALGILLAGSLLDRIPGIRLLHKLLLPYGQAIGVLGMLVGLSAFL